MNEQALKIVTHWSRTAGEFQQPRILRVYWPDGDNLLYSVDPVVAGDWIYHGVSTEDDPRGIMNSYEVAEVIMIPDMRTLGVQYTVRLNKARKPDSFEAA
jgi:hypothetical protein